MPAKADITPATGTVPPIGGTIPSGTIPRPARRGGSQRTPIGVRKPAPHAAVPPMGGTMPGQPAPKAARPPIRVHKRPRTPNAHACTSPRFLGSKFPPFFTCWRKTRRSNGGSRRHRRRICLNGMTAVSKTAGLRPTGVRIPHLGRTVRPYKHRTPPASHSIPRVAGRLATRQSGGHWPPQHKGPPERQGRLALMPFQETGDGRRSHWSRKPCC